MIAQIEHIEFNGKPYCIKVYSVKKEQPHYHQNGVLEIMFCLKGKIKVRNYYNEDDFLEGDIISFDSNDIHTIRSSGDNLIVSFFFDLLDPIFEGPTLPHHCFNCNKYAGKAALHINEIKHKLLTLLSLYIMPDSKMSIPEKNGYKNNLSKEILCIMLKHFLIICSDDIYLESYRPEFKERFQSILVYINQHFNEKITIKQLGVLSHVDPNYLSHLFKQVNVDGFKNYLYLIRIYLSEKMLLDEYRLTVTEISDKCGFSDPKLYYREFKKYYGRTPYQHVLYYRNYLKSVEPNKYYSENLPLLLNELIVFHYTCFDL